jgi:6,7-dimethyl-8-ribityllumazine synthase
MLKTAPRRKIAARGARVAIVASRYNAAHVNSMVRAAKETLGRAGAEFEIVRVPGAFECPVAAATLARRSTGRPDAVIVLGLIWRGETTHADQIGGAVTDALMRIALETGVPVVHEVITVSTAEQARARCLDPATNRGIEAARTALETASVLKRIAGRRAG